MTESNTVVLGSISGVNGATASTRVGIGTNRPIATLHAVDNGMGALLGVSNIAGNIAVKEGEKVRFVAKDLRSSASILLGAE